MKIKELEEELKKWKPNFGVQVAFETAECKYCFDVERAEMPKFSRHLLLIISPGKGQKWVCEGDPFARIFRTVPDKKEGEK